MWIEINDREPAALYLYHDAMPAAKGVKGIGHHKPDVSWLSWDKRFGPVEAVTKLASHDFAPHQLLIATQRILYIAFRVWKKIWIDIDKLANPV